MPNEFPTKKEPSLRRRALVGLGALAIATTATVVGLQMEKAEPAGTAEITASQQNFLDQTAADTATRLLKDRFALTKKVTTANDTTTVDVMQDMPNVGRSHQYAGLRFTFEGTSSGTDAASVEHFLRSQHPHLLSADVSKEGKFKVTVSGADSEQPTIAVAMPSLALHPHNDALPFSQYPVFDRAAAITYGVNGGIGTGGIVNDPGRVFPSGMPDAA